MLGIVLHMQCASTYGHKLNNSSFSSLFKFYEKISTRWLSAVYIITSCLREESIVESPSGTCGMWSVRMHAIEWGIDYVFFSIVLLVLKVNTYSNCKWEVSGIDYGARKRPRSPFLNIVSHERVSYSQVAWGEKVWSRKRVVEKPHP